MLAMGSGYARGLRRAACRGMTRSMHAREFGGALAWKTRARQALATSRGRLLDLLRPLPAEVLVAQHSPIMSPAVWDVAHVANYEEQWLVRALGEPGLSGPETDKLYDAFRTPRRNRGSLPLLGVEEAFAYAEQVRARALRRLEAVNDEDLARTGALLDGGFVYGMVAQHEQQHVATLVATLQLVSSTALEPLRSGVPRPGRAVREGEVHVPAGTCTSPSRTARPGRGTPERRGSRAVELTSCRVATSVATCCCSCWATMPYTKPPSRSAPVRARSSSFTASSRRSARARTCSA